MYKSIKKRTGEDWIQSLKTEIEPLFINTILVLTVRNFLGEGWKEGAGKVQRTEEEGNEKMEDKTTEVETDEEEGRKEGERINQTKHRQKEDETDTRTEKEEGIEEEEETEQAKPRRDKETE